MYLSCDVVCCYLGVLNVFFLYFLDDQHSKDNEESDEDRDRKASTCTGRVVVVSLVSEED